MVLFVVLFCVLVALGFGLASAWSDFQGLKIPNIYPACILLTFIPAFVVMLWMGEGAEYFMSVKSHFLSFAIVFGVTFILFSLGWFGAGDSKLCAAYAIWFGLPALPAFLFYMAITGGLLGILSLVFKKFKPVKAPKEGGWIENAQAGKNVVPYGIAIFAGAAGAFYKAGYMNMEKIALLAQLG